VLLPHGRCPFCWQMFGSVAALAAHMKVSHDKLGCSCPDDSTLQVRCLFMCYLGRPVIWTSQCACGR
jgi:hypothetical protein